jgi:hypothetical protein
VWLLTLPLAIVGSQAGHALAYRLVTPDGAARAHQLASTGHGYLAYAPLALAVFSVVVLLALGVELRHVVSGGRVARPSAFTFAVLAPAIFVFQEHFERLLHDGVLPWSAVLEPTFAAGLLLQVPFAAAAYLLARLLLRVVRSLGRILSRPPRTRDLVGPGLRPATRIAVPRVPVLALGYGSRGPPVPRS